MKTIQLGAECAMLLLQVMQLNAEAKDGRYYTFDYSGGTDAIVISKYNDFEQTVHMTHYINEVYGSPLERLFEFIENERNGIRQGRLSDAEGEGAEDEEV